MNFPTKRTLLTRLARHSRVLLAAGFMLGGAAASAQECSDWESEQPDWLFCDDFESGNLSNWIDINGIGVSSSANEAHDGSHAAELHYSSGDNGAGWMWVKGLRSHSSSADSQYIRWWQMWEDGFVFQNQSGDQKQFMLYALDPADEWAQTSNWKLYLHMSNSGAGNNELVIDRHLTAANDWQTYRQGNPQILYETGQWYCMEAEITHNTPGSQNGAIRAWIDDTLVIEESNLRLRDDATSWNAIQMDGWYAGSVPQDQFSWIDQVVVSSSRIGCDGAAAAVRPEAPADLRTD